MGLGRQGVRYGTVYRNGSRGTGDKMIFDLGFFPTIGGRCVDVLPERKKLAVSSGDFKGEHRAGRSFLVESRCMRNMRDFSRSDCHLSRQLRLGGTY